MHCCPTVVVESAYKCLSIPYYLYVNDYHISGRRLWKMTPDKYGVNLAETPYKHRRCLRGGSSRDTFIPLYHPVVCDPGRLYSHTFIGGRGGLLPILCIVAIDGWPSPQFWYFFHGRKLYRTSSFSTEIEQKFILYSKENIIPISMVVK